MTDPDERPDDAGLRPAWRRGSARPVQPAVDLSVEPAPAAPVAPPTSAEPPPPAEDDLERGRTLALLAALGRLQFSIDVLSRQQQRHADEVKERLDRIERALGRSGAGGPAGG